MADTPAITQARMDEDRVAVATADNGVECSFAKSEASHHSALMWDPIVMSSVPSNLASHRLKRQRC